MARLSVIIPAYNAASTIARTLSSALAQNHQDYSVIVVDDGSTDNTAAIVAHFAAIDNRVQLYQQANGGPVAARNAAIGLSDGEFIAPLDADDIWHPYYLSWHQAALERSSAGGFSYSHYRWIDASDRVFFDGPRVQVNGSALHRHLLVNFVGNGSSAVFRRNALQQAGNYPVEAIKWRGAEDYLLQLRIAATSEIACVPLFLTGYRRSASSLSAQDPLRIETARRNAVELVAREAGIRDRAILRWGSAEAARSAAAISLMRGRPVMAAQRGLVALAQDPAGTAKEFFQRARSSLRRKSAVTGPVFGELDPSKAYMARPAVISAKRLEYGEMQDSGPASDQASPGEDGR